MPPSRTFSLISWGWIALHFFFGTDVHAQKIGAVFVINFENRNWTQPANDKTSHEQIFGNPAAPYINSLVTAGNPHSDLVAYACAYHNVLSTPSGANPSIHPSEPNYLWQEAASNLGVRDDNDPYGPGDQVDAISQYLTNHPEASGQHLTGLLQKAGISWMSYQEDTNLQNTEGENGNGGGVLTSKPVGRDQTTVPLASFAGTSPSYTNPYNGSHQYSFACKHDGTLFFPDTNGHGDPTAANVSAAHYAPLQRLFEDLKTNRVARYNLITPDEYNDMHTPLRNGFTYHGTPYTGDLAMLAQGDNFLSKVIPEIESSEAFKNNGVIIIWTDETEGYNLNDFNHTLMEIVLSPLSKGKAYRVADDLTHSSDVATWQKVFHLRAATTTGFINDAANPSHGSGTLDLSGFFKPGVIPTTLDQ